MKSTFIQPENMSIPILKSARDEKEQLITWDAFQRIYLRKEDGYKYEWVESKVVKSKRTMDRTQLYMLENLLDFFDLLKFKKLVSGRLISEPDLFFQNNHRRPDVAWLTTEQIYKLSDPNTYEVPAFLIEVISSSDQINRVKKKLISYSDAGVQVVWHIFPEHQQIDVYSGKNLQKMKVCVGDDICSAAPALPYFEIKASDVFKKMN
jgi:Uma2 family endonuclease